MSPFASATVGAVAEKQVSLEATGPLVDGDDRGLLTRELWGRYWQLLRSSVWEVGTPFLHLFAIRSSIVIPIGNALARVAWVFDDPPNTSTTPNSQDTMGAPGLCGNPQRLSGVAC